MHRDVNDSLYADLETPTLPARRAQGDLAAWGNRSGGWLFRNMSSQSQSQSVEPLLQAALVKRGPS
jgi:hypothetical protein